ncbi:MAG TPA: ATP--guanido phosphotransferase [Clostridiales bacterium]|nr:protein arginine kinase [Saccharofermentanaceae bacterium]HAU51103.1 ATP--guanido phosphotransferase [Clostridiales bacterium]HBY32140.1 ATP--guanido phosphotransferase [Clostridiales bacterium]HBZ77245.1 ATP--guanido phosphotransferase [Clostridiales bacterium]
MSWYLEAGNDSDIVLSSRIRLARNLKGIPFPNRMNDESRKKVLEQISDAMLKRPGNDLMRMDIASLPETDRRALIENHLISEELAKGQEGQSVFISKDENVSVMVNEEDHLRIQVMAPGFALENTYKQAEEIAIYLEKALPIAFSEKYGFLTAYPSNTGTGLRASVMVHLPIVTSIGKMPNLIDSLSKAGYTVRGVYGEKSKPAGNIYQISNTITLGISESKTLSNFAKMINEVIALERKLRKDYYEKNKERLEDKVYRSLGELTYARMLPAGEAMNRLSDLRVGVACGFMKDIDERQLMLLLNTIGDASVQKRCGEVLLPKDIATKRAEFVREVLTKKEEKRNENE